MSPLKLVEMTLAKGKILSSAFPHIQIEVEKIISP
jgi:hypothetical protein